MSRSFRSAAVVLLVLSPLAPGLRAQPVEVAFAPRGTAIRPCDELEVEVRLRHSGGPAVAGYQLFLRFPAESFEVVRYEPDALAGTVTVAAPAPLGSGFPGCGTVADPWDDGLGGDVVAVAATSIAEGGSGTPIENGEALLGVLVFRPKEGAASEPAPFRAVEESCIILIEQEGRTFDAGGSALETTVDATFDASVAGPGVPLEGLACALTDAEEASLSWGDPAAAVEGVRVYRNDELVAELPADARAFSETAAELATLRYRVVWVASGVESCDAGTCELTREITFRRGDIDGDAAFSVTDAVRLLGQLFRSEALSCADASDVNDDGRVNISDAVFLLSFLFRSGEEPTAPFPGLGSDPTADDLDCEQYP